MGCPADWIHFTGDAVSLPTIHFGMYGFIRALSLELHKSSEWLPTIQGKELPSSVGSFAM